MIKSFSTLIVISRAYTTQVFNPLYRQKTKIWLTAVAQSAERLTDEKKAKGGKSHVTVL
jgi:hypothetical protein